MATAKADPPVASSEPDDDDVAGDDAATDAGDPAGGPDDGTEATAAAQALAFGSADLAAKLEEVNAAYIDAVIALVGPDAPLSGCERCQGRGYTLEGMSDAIELVHPDEYRPCERCNGWGELETGSRRPDRKTTVCTECAGNGWKVVNLQPPAPFTPFPDPRFQVQQPPSAEQAQMGTLLPDGRFLPFGSDTPVQLVRP